MTLDADDIRMINLIADEVCTRMLVDCLSKVAGIPNPLKENGWLK